MKNYVFLSPDEQFVITFENDNEVESAVELVRDTDFAIYGVEGYKALTVLLNDMQFETELEAVEYVLTKANIKYIVRDWLDEDGDIIPEHENEDFEAIYF